MAWAWLKRRNKFVALTTMQHWLQTGGQVSKFHYSLWHKEQSDQLSIKSIALHLQTLELFQAPSKQPHDHLFNVLRCYTNIFIITVSKFLYSSNSFNVIITNIQYSDSAWHGQNFLVLYLFEPCHKEGKLHHFLSHNQNCDPFDKSSNLQLMVPLKMSRKQAKDSVIKFV